MQTANNGLRFRYQERANRPAFGRQATVNRFEVPPPRRRCLQKLDHLLNGLRLSRGVTRCGSIADKKPAVAHNAVADRTETREEDKKPLFEECWDRIVEVRRGSKGPQFFEDLRGVRGRYKKVGTNRKRLATCSMERSLFLEMLRYFYWIGASETITVAGLVTKLGILRMVMMHSLLQAKTLPNSQPPTPVP